MYVRIDGIIHYFSTDEAYRAFVSPKVADEPKENKGKKGKRK